MSLLGPTRTGSGPVMVWLHGFTQTEDSAHSFRSILTGTYELLTLDLPGHGQNAPIRATLNETADLLAAILPREPFILGGYSMGARVALHLALRHRERLSALVLLSATLGIRDEHDRSTRRANDEQLARRVEEIGASAFLDEWLARPMFRDLPRDPDERAARSHDAQGLANALRDAGTGTQSWLGVDFVDFDVPTLVLAGARDEKFTHEARLLNDAIPRSLVRLIEHAGHAAHLERASDVAAHVVGLQPQ